MPRALNRLFNVCVCVCIKFLFLQPRPRKDPLVKFGHGHQNRPDTRTLQVACCTQACKTVCISFGLERGGWFSTLAHMRCCCWCNCRSDDVSPVTPERPHGTNPTFFLITGWSKIVESLIANGMPVIDDSYSYRTPKRLGFFFLLRPVRLKEFPLSTR